MFKKYIALILAMCMLLTSASALAVTRASYEKAPEKTLRSLWDAKALKRLKDFEYDAIEVIYFDRDQYAGIYFMDFNPIGEYDKLKAALEKKFKLKLEPVEWSDTVVNCEVGDDFYVEMRKEGEIAVSQVGIQKYGKSADNVKKFADSVLKKVDLKLPSSLKKLDTLERHIQFSKDSGLGYSTDYLVSKDVAKKAVKYYTELTGGEGDEEFGVWGNYEDISFSVTYWDQDDAAHVQVYGFFAPPETAE